MLLAVGIVGFGSDPSLTLAPAVTEELGGITDLSSVRAVFGAGAVATLAVALRCRPQVLGRPGWVSLRQRTGCGWCQRLCITT